MILLPGTSLDHSGPSPLAHGIRAIIRSPSVVMSARIWAIDRILPSPCWLAESKLGYLAAKTLAEVIQHPVCLVDVARIGAHSYDDVDQLWHHPLYLDCCRQHLA